MVMSLAAHRFETSTWRELPSSWQRNWKWLTNMKSKTECSLCLPEKPWLIEYIRNVERSHQVSGVECRWPSTRLFYIQCVRLHLGLPPARLWVQMSSGPRWEHVSHIHIIVSWSAEPGLTSVVSKVALNAAFHIFLCISNVVTTVMC